MISDKANYTKYLQNNTELFLSSTYTISFRFKGVLEYKSINLGDEGWKILFNNSKRALGICKFSKKTITLSRYFFNETSGHSHERLTNTILHEIAHAIDFSIRKKSGHDKFWQSIALQIGCDGKRCASDSFDNQISKYSLVCPNCKYVNPYHRKPSGIKVCSICADKDYEALRLKNNRRKYANYVIDKYQLQIERNF